MYLKTSLLPCYFKGWNTRHGTDSDHLWANYCTSYWNSSMGLKFLVAAVEREIQNINEEKIFVILSIFIQFFVFYPFPVWTARELEIDNKNGQFLFDFFFKLSYHKWMRKRYEWAEDKSSAKLWPTFHKGYFVLFKYNV